ncbi:MAG: hypothetical protein FWF42_02680 [Streptococcaceae bacterium]|nr:hypothetical protein [Streptococcaceae bacterium]MCL2681512.1 hypothetical protein [Streptococcaceae bacterium]MCL2858574.1 hypothetical protein [Streptococcaceae bacterium]
MKKGGLGGENTQTGAVFEKNTDLATFLHSLKGYTIIDNDYVQLKTKKKKWKKQFRWKVLFEEKEVGEIFQQNGLYRYFDEIGHDYQSIISKKLLPDDSIFVISKNTVHIIEKKWQEGTGSVDEKPQTVHFKMIQYKKLFAPLNKEIEFMYLFNRSWWDKPVYKDMFDYILSVGAYYYFDYIPLKKLGLPTPERERNE